MKHPNNSELLEYSRKLPEPEQQEIIEAHLESCETCRREVDELRALGGRLGEWDDVDLPEDYVQAQIRLLDSRLQGVGAPRWRLTGRFRILSPASIRGAIIAATAVLSTIAVQGLFLSPLSMQREIRTVFEMAPLPLSYPAAGAIPDTMIVLNVHADGSYSTSIFEGVYSFEALKAQLAREVHRGEYWTLAVNATELRNPFNLRLKDLAFFKRKLGINEFRFWTDDVVARMSRRNLTLEELEQIVGAGQPRIEVTPEGIDIQALHQVNLTIGTNGSITLYGHVITMAEMLNILGNYHTLNPEGKLQIHYWESSVADSVLTLVLQLAGEVGIQDINDVKLRSR
jgi:hypothetical protein